MSLAISFLALFLLFGCTLEEVKEAITGEDTGPVALEILGLEAINSHNVGEYSVQGSCMADEVDEIFYILIGSRGGLLRGNLSCVEGNWELPITAEELSTFDDGKLVLTLTSSDFSVSRVIAKDLLKPRLTDILQRGEDIWYWKCDINSPCSQYRAIINDLPAYEFSEDDPFGDIGEVQVPRDWMENGDREFYIHVQAQDTAGNLSEVLTSDAFRPDNIAPILASLSSGDGSWTWSCSEENCEYRFFISESAFAPAEMTGSYGPVTEATPVSGHGEYYVHVQVRDSSGNESAVTSYDSAITVTVDDTIPPQVNGVGAEAGGYRAEEEIILAVSFLEPVQVIGEPRLEILIGESTRAMAQFVGTPGSNAIVHEFIYRVKDGHSGKVKAINFTFNDGDSIVDEAGNPASALWARNYIVEKVNVDTTIPEVNGLTDDYEPKNFKTWTWSCSEDHCLYRSVVNEQESFLFANQPYGHTDAINESSANGMRYLHVQAKDLADNESMVVSVLAIIDDTSPVVDIIDEGGFWSWSCTDISACEYRFAINTGPAHLFEKTDAYGAINSVTPSSDFGTYYVYVQARDMAGNLSAVIQGAPVTVSAPDETPPEVTEVSAPFGLYGIGDRIAITVSFSEPVSMANDEINLEIDIGSSSQTARFSGMSEELNTTKIFEYTVQNGDEGHIVATSLVVNDIVDTMQDSVGNNAVIDFVNVVMADVILDGIAPTIMLDDDNIHWIWSCSEFCVYRYTINQLSHYTFAEDWDYDSNMTSHPLSGEGGTNYLHIQAVDLAGNQSELASRSYYLAGSLAVLDIEKDDFEWSWSCAPIDNCETRFVVSKSPIAPEIISFSSYSDTVQETSAIKGEGTYYLHIQVREKNDTSRISAINSSAEPIVVKSNLWRSLAVGDGHSCIANPQSRCWGLNHKGQLGIDNTTDQSYPGVDINTSRIQSDQFLQIDAGREFSCALLAASNGRERINCWGDGFYAQLGYYSDSYKEKPGSYISGHNDLLDVSLGDLHGCALKANGQVICWGWKADGRVGDGAVSNLLSRSEPKIVRSSSSKAKLKKVIQITSGYHHSCALKFDGTVWCWGNGGSGEIGDGEKKDRSYGKQVLRAEDTPLDNIVQIDAGDAFTCATMTDRTVWCWGRTSDGRRGGSIPEWSRNYATRVGNLDDVREVALGSSHACALKGSDGSVWCWGGDKSGQLGRGEKDSSNRSTPAPVVAYGGVAGVGPYLAGVSDIESGGEVSCASNDFDGVLCWGKRGDKQLGDGSDSGYAAYPVQVLASLSPSAPLAAHSFRSGYYCIEGRCAIDGVSMALTGGSVSPSNHASLSVEVSGLLSGQTVKIYREADCSGTVLATINTDSTITLTALEGRNTFYFTKGMGDMVDSDCSQSALGYVLDNIEPAVFAVYIPAGPFVSGDNLDIVVAFDEAVTVTDAPQLSITGLGMANYVEHEGVRVVFRYLVGDNINLNGITLGSAMDLNGGSITDSVNNSATQVILTDTNFPDVVIDSALPEVTLDSPVGLVTNGANANVINYPLSGDCESGLPVMINITGIFPVVLSCDSERWASDFDLSNVQPGAATITVSQRDDSDNIAQVEEVISVGAFEQVVFYHQKMGLTAHVACRISPRRQVYCWGVNSLGSLGTGILATNMDIHPPQRVIDVGESEGSTNYLSNVVQISVVRGDSFIAHRYPAFCALVIEDGTGKVRCWGSNIPHKSLFDAPIVHGLYSSVPIAVTNSNDEEVENVIQVASGVEHSCALKSSGQVFCWGIHDDGQLGIGSQGENSNAKRYFSSAVMKGVDEPLTGIIQIAVWAHVSCALNTSRNVFCWGKELHGELGNRGGYESISAYAVPVRDYSGDEGTTLNDVVKVFSGKEYQFCALHSNHTLSCWGRLRKDYGVGARNRPVFMAEFIASNQPFKELNDVAQVAFGSYTSDGCLLKTNGGPVHCWGEGRSGTLGNGTSGIASIVRLTSSYSPLNLASPVEIMKGVPVMGVVDIEGTGSYRCVLVESGEMKCWGRNDYGALGDATTTDRHRAVSVLEGPGIDSSPLFMGMGPGRSGYHCRDGYSRCFLRGTVLKMADGYGNPTNSLSPVVDVIGLGEDETLSLYSDSSCQTAITDGHLSGSDATQSITLSNSDTQNETRIFYQVSGGANQDGSACFNAALIFDRIDPEDPIVIYTVAQERVVPSDGMIQVARDVAVNITGGETGIHLRVYLNDSSCRGVPFIERLATNNLELDFAVEGTTASYAGVESTAVVNSIHVQLEDHAGNQSICAIGTLGSP